MKHEIGDQDTGSDRAGRVPQEAPPRGATDLERRRFLRQGAACLICGSLIPPMPFGLDLFLSPAFIEPEEGESLPFAMPSTMLGYGVTPGTVDKRPLFLTFDDGPLHCTGTILDELATRKQKATFFVIGKNLENTELRKLAVRALIEGHELGNHSYSHPHFSRLSAGNAEKEIVEAHKLIEEMVKEAGNVNARVQNLFFRFPYGDGGSSANSSHCRKVLARLGYRIAWWDVDTRDWRMASGKASTVVASLNRAKPRDVVLLHDRRRTAQVLPSLLGVLQSRRMFSLPLSSYESIPERSSSDGAKAGESGVETPAVPPIFDWLF